MCSLLLQPADGTEQSLLILHVRSLVDSGAALVWLNPVSSRTAKVLPQILQFGIRLMRYWNIPSHRFSEAVKTRSNRTSGSPFGGLKSARS